MEKFESFIKVYEDYIINKNTLIGSRKVPKIKTFGMMTILVLLAYFGGLLVGSLNYIGYLLTVGNVIVVSSYVVYKVLRGIQYNNTFEKSYPISLIAGVNALFVFVTVITASLLLLLTVYISTASILLIVVYGLLFIISSVIYTMIYKKTETISIPCTKKLILNGFFIGILFYALTAVVHVNNIPLSYIIVAPLVLVTIVLKQYLEKRFIFSINRIAVVSLGIFLILLSIPFTRAFNFASVYRGELTFNMIYETLGEEAHEFPEGVTGDVMFYEDYTIIADEEVIRFYDEDFVLSFTIDNDYSAVYVMNGKLLANKITDITSRYIDLYEFELNEFNLVGEYFAYEPNDLVYVEDNAYFSVGGNIYMKEETETEYIYMEIDSIPNSAVFEQYENYIVFREAFPIFATTNSFREEVQGNVYKNIAYNNDHLAFVYNSTYVSNNPDKVIPIDQTRIVVYLTSTDDYFKVDAEVPSSILMPKLFRINEFYYVDGYYYIVGYVEYSTHDFNYMILVVNEDGDIEKELVYEGPSFAMSDEYIAYGDDTIKVYPIDAKPNHVYRIVEGYGTMFATISLVALFAVEKIQLNAKERKENSI